MKLGKRTSIKVIILSSGHTDDDPGRRSYLDYPPFNSYKLKPTRQSKRQLKARMAVKLNRPNTSFIFNLNCSRVEMARFNYSAKQ